jgi:hypothetical protein
MPSPIWGNPMKSAESLLDFSDIYMSNPTGMTFDFLECSVEAWRPFSNP